MTTQQLEIETPSFRDALTNLVIATIPQSLYPEGIEVQHTIGLGPYLGYELISCGHLSQEDFAQMAALMIDPDPTHYLAAKIPAETMELLGLPDGDWRQFVFRTEVAGKPTMEWSGGTCLLLPEQISEALSAAEVAAGNQALHQTEQTRKLVRERIAEKGFAVIAVEADDDTPTSINIAYTAGLSLRGLPELLMLGWVAVESLSEIVVEVGYRFISQPQVYGADQDWLFEDFMASDGSFETERSSRSLRILRVDPIHATSEYMLQLLPTMEFYRSIDRSEKISLLMVSDEQGRFPGDDGYSEPQLRQRELPPPNAAV